MATEKKPPQQLLKEINKAGTDKLQHVEPRVENSLPSAEDVAQEKSHQQLLEGVSHFDANKLHHADTKERVVLPDTSSPCLQHCDRTKSVEFQTQGRSEQKNQQWLQQCIVRFFTSGVKISGLTGGIFKTRSMRYGVDKLKNVTGGNALCRRSSRVPPRAHDNGKEEKCWFQKSVRCCHVMAYVEAVPLVRYDCADTAH
ncbi:hypothetical protein BaRGS_00012398 [Batillaria attramentaria]|uniref:Uncharacterized protein n=1 Tax=Batillaria attramentaria TaxID=370345 RepID=A0ABD0LB18_9CAEN